jgi:metallophosphoesterase superfamily enzyme
LTVDDRPVLIGDNIKVAKEAQRMPGVKKLHQDSENSGKSEYIFGHNHGVVGILANAGTSVSLHSGNV